MTNKVELNELTQVVHKEQAFLTALNDNFARLQKAINDTLSRSGVVPNQMQEVLDMNGKRIVNVGDATEDTDALTKRFIDGLISQVEEAIARLSELTNQAIQAVQLFYTENIYPDMIAAKEDSQEAARDANTYAEHAETWAEGSDEDVQVLGGTHSAKKWAELSQADVAAEAEARENADTGLQNQIDAIVAGADVKDIVGTYADLQNYDTSTLGNNDVVKVITDSTHNDASSYYKWIITGDVGSWNYIGSEGPYLTPAAAASTYVPKTTTINSKALSGNITLDASDVGAATAAQGSKADSALQATDIVSSVDASSTNTKAVGAKLFYDTCGDIETLINAL